MKRGLSFLIAAMIAPTLASAHLTGGSGLLAGATHPLLGWDHLLAMLAVGVLAAHDRIDWSLPAVFVGVMVLGGVIGTFMGALPFVELGIIMSVAVFGMLIAFRKKLPKWALLSLVGFAGLLHGHAHGTEIPVMASPILYSLGFATITGCLHLTGVFGARYLSKARFGVPLIRTIGAAMALAVVAII